MNTDLVFMYQGKVSVLGFNITGKNGAWAFWGVNKY
jgi:hypothetical protein